MEQKILICAAIVMLWWSAVSVSVQQDKRDKMIDAIWGILLFVYFAVSAAMMDQ